jgi:RNase P/RNase MRP subunit p30
MKIYEALIAVIGLCLIIYLAGFYGRGNAKVYSCYEVTKSDPKDVQDLCKKLRRVESGN